MAVAAPPRVYELRFFDTNHALEQAKSQSTQSEQGRLAGSIFAVKDHIDVAGMPQSLGTLRGAVGSSSIAAVLLLESHGLEFKERKVNCIQYS